MEPTVHCSVCRGVACGAPLSVGLQRSGCLMNVVTSNDSRYGQWCQSLLSLRAIYLFMKFIKHRFKVTTQRRSSPGPSENKGFKELVKGAEKTRGRERSSDGRLFQAEGPTIEKAMCCLMVMQAWGTTKSLLEAEQRDCRPEQAEVRMKSSSK